ncbi:MAG TPA: sigma-54 dependent transcriptional regulator [Thermoanaerobaculia bacterium]|jgi:DNA-binding NtrC family response regulator|nr:sigma-54 dependent transcriptional regulator [Thermoanaerobaculia bacterium]
MLILDFDSVSNLGGELRGILESIGEHVELRQLPRREQIEPQDLTGPVASPCPAAILLVLPAAVMAAPESLLRSVRRHAPEAPIVAVTAGGEPGDILRLLELGVHDFISAPLRAWDVLPRVCRLVGRARGPGAGAGVGKLREVLGLRHLLGESPSFVAVIEKIPLVARCDASVLICGETGTGKELVARAIHYLSPRAKKPFLAVNCGAVPAELVENELFGHERSAYTGAFTAQAGVVQEAEGGTLLLDEIDALPLLAQVKLLRFLQDKEFRPLGSTRVQRADVRILAAGNGDLEGAVRDGRLRQDLYYRLHVIPLHLPPLRERRDDIPRLARHFLCKHAVAARPAELSPRALQALLDHDWPGNVRELEHAIERAAVLCADEELICERHVMLPRTADCVPTDAESFRRAKARAVARFEASYVRELLVTHQGNISRAARAADKNRRAFWELLRKHGIDARSFRGGDAVAKPTRL